jgi:uncharacterized protein with HEPN domain
MSRRYVLYLKDMEEACIKVREFSDGLTYEEFISYGMPYHAIVRLIEVIGEAAKAIPGNWLCVWQPRWRGRAEAANI